MKRYQEKHEFKEGKFTERALLGVPKPFESKVSLPKGRVLSLVRERLGEIMQEIREHQVDDPELPRKPFSKRLLRDVEDRMAHEMEIPASFSIRFYSAVDTALDLAGVDFWIELYDDSQNKALTSYKIDLKLDPHGNPGPMADQAFYYDYNAEDSQIFQTRGYRNLVEDIAGHLVNYVNRQRVTNKSRENIQGLFPKS